MKPSRLQHASAAFRIAFVIIAFAALSACEQNTFVPAPPPKVEVAMPVQKAVTRYLDATGNTAAIRASTWSRACRAFCKRSITRTARL